MKRPIIIKSFSGLLNLLICLTGAFLGSCLTGPTKETILIPDYFEGEFRIAYGEKCGLNPKIENGRRILEIPENGLLIIQPQFEAGIIDHQYYFFDSDFNRARINQILDYKGRITKMPGVLVGGSGVMDGLIPDGGLSSESPAAINFTDFIVFNKDTTTVPEFELYKASQRFDSITTALVKKCRQTGSNRQ